MIKKISKCRLCSSSKLQTIWNLKKSPIGDDYTKSKNTAKIFPLSLNQCSNCKFVQLSHYIDEKIVYGNYLYVTKTSLGLQNHFKRNSKINLKFGNIKNNILDIGSNDGSNLEIYKKSNLDVVGIEPAKKIAEIANRKKIKTYNFFFTEKASKLIKEKHGTFDLITIFNLTANIDGLDKFIDNVINLMNEKSILNIETFSWAGIIDKNLIDNIYHEHISYFHLKPLIKFFKKKGLEVIRSEYNNSKGSSLLIHLAKKKSYKINNRSILKCLNYEKKLKLNRKNVCQNIINLNKKIKLKIHRILDRTSNKFKIVGFGASCGTTTLLTYFEIAHYLDCLVDDEKLRHNLYSPYYNLKVKKPESLSDKKVLILAWRYSKNIISKHKKQIKNKNIIKILPQVS